jgi:multiple sugar transport system ATP-binding protein
MSAPPDASSNGRTGTIRCDSLTKVYGDGTRALDALDLTVEGGQLLALVGPSGCGKTTLLRMIAGLEHITEGELVIDGRVVNRVPPRDRDISMVFQNYALYPHMSVFDNIAFGLRVRRVKRSVIKERVLPTAELLGLTSSLQKKPGQMSGGQRQRVAMGRAIVREPKIFLMDEPLSNLDAQLRVQMRTEIARLQQRLGVTTIYVTHDQTEAMVLGDMVAVLKDGVLQQHATPEEVYSRPANAFVARFIGAPSMNVLPATVHADADRVVVELGACKLAFSPDAVGRVNELNGPRHVLCGIRPEALEEVVGGAESTESSTLRGSVELREDLGPEILVHVDVPGAPRALGGYVDDPGAVDDVTLGTSGLIVARLSPRSRARQGDVVELSVDPAGLHFFDPTGGQRVEVWQGRRTG